MQEVVPAFAIQILHHPLIQEPLHLVVAETLCRYLLQGHFLDLEQLTQEEVAELVKTVLMVVLAS
jgi:hypothetical protein